MACLLIEARDAAGCARRDGKAALDAAALEDLVARYRALAASGLAANLYRGTVTARDASRIARRFMKYEDMILRFATHPDLGIFTNNEAERTFRPVKVQQRSSGGCWRTLQGLADFAVVQSYLSTAANGASANSTPSAASSTVIPGCHPDLSRPDNTAWRHQVHGFLDRSSRPVPGVPRPPRAGRRAVDGWSPVPVRIIAVTGRIMGAGGSVLKREAGCPGSGVAYAQQSIQYRLRLPGGGAIRPGVTC
jgi:hypothetical protein